VVVAVAMMQVKKLAQLAAQVVVAQELIQPRAVLELLIKVLRVELVFLAEQVCLLVVVVVVQVQLAQMLVVRKQE
jgi:hypothetical protein